MRSDSYATILGAVGNVLDLAGARSFSVRDAEHGLTVELVDGRGESHAIEFSVAEVAALMSWATPDAEPTVATVRHDEGTLRGFMENRMLVGAR